MTTTPRLVKLPTQVNTSDAPAHFGGSFTQDGGHITALQDGGYVVVWTDGSRTHNIDGNAVVGRAAIRFRRQSGRRRGQDQPVQ